MESSRLLVAAVVSGFISTAIGQTSPRVDYRVLAEVGTSSGPWPAIDPGWTQGNPRMMLQFASGEVVWDGGALYSIDDDGAAEILAAGTRVSGLPDADFRFALQPDGLGYGSRVVELRDRRSAFRVRYSPLAPGQAGGEAWIVGRPRQPEFAENRIVSKIRGDGACLLWSGGGVLQVGMLGGEFLPLDLNRMEIGGLAPQGSLFSILEDASFGGESAIMIKGVTAPPFRWIRGLYINGQLRATSFQGESIPGVPTPISSGSRICGVLEDETALMWQPGAAWMVFPDGRGREIASPLIPLPGYGPDGFAVQPIPFATADGRIYLSVRGATNESPQAFFPGLFEYENGELRPIAISGDPRLGSSRNVGVPNGLAANVWFTSGGRGAWTNGQGIGLVERSGAVALVASAGDPTPLPGVLGSFGVVEDVGVSDVRGTDEVSIGTDASSGTTRMARDGSIAFWVRMRAAGGVRRVFVVSARLDVCPPDINEDGFVDFFDYDAFLACFESGEACGRFNVGDFNQDGFTDFFDYMGFVEAFEVGC
ncbi:MAG: hypothetical protein HEQ23_10715 [Tepidisphaera sp.]